MHRRLPPHPSRPSSFLRADMATACHPLLQRHEAVAPYVPCRILGQGASGVVLLARDPASRRYVAIKASHDPAQRARLQCEYRALARFRFCPHVVAVVPGSLQVAPDLTWFAMERLLPLSARLAELGALPSTECAAIALQVMRALQVMHRHNTVHCDVSLANVLYKPKPRACGAATTLLVKLADFGMATIRDVVRQPERRGTSWYMSRRVMRWGGYCPLDDLESLAFVVLHLLLGERLPWCKEEQDSRILRLKRQAVQGVASLAPTASPALVRWMTMVWGLTRADRIPYQALLVLLEEASREPCVDAAAIPALVPSTKRQRIGDTPLPASGTGTPTAATAPRESQPKGSSTPTPSSSITTQRTIPSEEGAS